MAETRQESCTYEDLEGKGKKGEWRPNTVFVPLPGWWSEQKVNVPERKANVQKAKTKGKAKAKAKAQKAEADLQKVDEAEEFYAAFAEELLKSMET